MAARLQNHLRKTFLAGVFAVIPIAATAFIIWYIDAHTRGIAQLIFGRDVPFAGIVIAILVIYLVGLAASSLLGKFFIVMIDRVLNKLPLLRELYTSWKQIALTPGGGEGMFARVVLIPGDTGNSRQMGFTCGTPIEGDPDTYCIFVPAAPNPMNGRLHFVPKDKCIFIDASNEEAFKFLLSTGNFVPPTIGPAMKMSMADGAAK